MRKCPALVIPLAATIFAAPAPAQDFYFGLGAGVSVFDDAVDTSGNAPFSPGQLPAEFSLDGRRFDSSETALEFTVGWNALDWLSLELGYTDFGNSGQAAQFGFIGPAPVVTPSPVSPPPGITPVPGPIVAGPFPANFNAAALEVEAWSLSAKFRWPLVADLSANWLVGISRASYDASGQFTFNEVVSLNPLVVNTTNVPFASPDDEIGYRAGFGFEWRFSDRFSADIGYRRHDTGALALDTVMLQFVVTP